QDDKGRDARKRAYCLKIQPATGSFARNLIYSTKPDRICRYHQNKLFFILYGHRGITQLSLLSLLRWYGNAVNLLMTILICSHSILVTSG
ncbi:hypothetical protein DMQ00_28100, partial [Klebsiella pneumoniae]